MPRTCLGTRLLNVSTKDNPSSLGSNRESRGFLLVELQENNKDLVLEINLLTESGESYACTLTPDAISSLSYEKPSSETTMALGRLLLRDDNNDVLEKEWQNKTIVFRFENSNGRQILHLLVHENLSNGMKRRILNETLERKDNGGFGYALALGNSLNRSLQETRQATSGRDHWKTTAKDLEKLQQQSKDVLLQNFTTLRNKMVANHQKELEELKKAHQAQMKAKEIELETAKQKAPYRKKKRPEPPELGITNELFDPEEIRALAEGRKLDSGKHHHRGSDKKIAAQKGPPLRKSFLEADQAVDMVKIRREGLEFQNRNSGKRKRSKERQKEDSHVEIIEEKEYNRKPKAIRDGNQCRQRKLDSPIKVVPKEKPAPEITSSEISSPSNRKSSPEQTTKIPPTLLDDASTSSESSWVLR